MSLVSLDLFKQHVRSDSFAGEDALLQHYLDAAETYLVRRTERSVHELLAMGGGTLPDDFVIAVLMLAAHWYDHREATSATVRTEVPYGVSAMITPFLALPKA